MKTEKLEKLKRLSDDQLANKITQLEKEIDTIQDILMNRIKKKINKERK